MAKHGDGYFQGMADGMVTRNQKIKYSKSKYMRMRHGIHTFDEYDDLVFWLVENNREYLIEWTD